MSDIAIPVIPAIHANTTATSSPTPSPIPVMRIAVLSFYSATGKLISSISRPMPGACPLSITIWQKVVGAYSTTELPVAYTYRGICDGIAYYSHNPQLDLMLSHTHTETAYSGSD